jgi:hypothetical protein
MKTRGLPRVTNLVILQDHVVLIRFSDGAERQLDLEPRMRGPVFGKIRDHPELFAQLTVDEELGTVVWPNGADLDPDVLYGSAAPSWTESSSASD